jgi:hypothetical protein
MDVVGFTCLSRLAQHTLDFDALQRQQDLFHLVFVHGTSYSVIVCCAAGPS